MLSAGGGLTREGGGHGDGGRSQAVGRSHQDLPSNASHTRSNFVAGSQLFPAPSCAFGLTLFSHSLSSSPLDLFLMSQLPAPPPNHPIAFELGDERLLW